MIHWDRYIAIIGRITQRPECWVQEVVMKPCGTAYCVWGHAALDANGGKDHDDPFGDPDFLDGGVKWLGVDNDEQNYIFRYDRTLAELQELAITQKFPWERAP